MKKKNGFKMCKCITESEYLNALTEYYCIVTHTETDKIHDIISLHVRHLPGRLGG